MSEVGETGTRDSGSKRHVRRRSIAVRAGLAARAIIQGSGLKPTALPSGDNSWLSRAGGYSLILEPRTRCVACSRHPSTVMVRYSGYSGSSAPDPVGLAAGLSSVACLVARFKPSVTSSPREPNPEIFVSASEAGRPKHPSVECHQETSSHNGDETTPSAAPRALVSPPAPLTATRQGRRAPAPLLLPARNTHRSDKRRRWGDTRTWHIGIFGASPSPPRPKAAGDVPRTRHARPAGECLCRRVTPPRPGCARPSWQRCPRGNTPRRDTRRVSSASWAAPLRGRCEQSVGYYPPHAMRSGHLCSECSHTRSRDASPYALLCFLAPCACAACQHLPPSAWTR